MYNMQERTRLTKNWSLARQLRIGTQSEAFYWNAGMVMADHQLVKLVYLCRRGTTC